MQPYIRKIHFYETDAMEVVHHSNYIRWFEEARIDYMDQMGYSYAKACGTGIDFAVLSVQCEYKSMVRFGETVEIHARISELTPTRMTIVYRVTDAVCGVLRTIGESRHCCISRLKGRPVSMQRELPELYELFRESMEGNLF